MQAAELATMNKMLRDMTEGKRAEEKLRRVVDAAPNAMIITDADGRIVLVNTQTEQIFGYHREELVGRPIEILVPDRFRRQHPRDREGFTADPRTRPMGVGRNLHGLRKDGSEVPVEIGLNPIYTDEGMLIVASILDITERQAGRRETPLIETDRRRGQPGQEPIPGQHEPRVANADELPSWA